MEELFGWSFITFLLVMAGWSPLLVLVHELGHALTALETTAGDVRLVVGSERGLALSVGRLEMRLFPLPVGMCQYEPATLLYPRAEAWIALAGPALSLIACLCLGLTAGILDGTASSIAASGALGAASHTLITLLPFRYGAGFGDLRGWDSDGRAAWRVLSGGVTRQGLLPREPRDRVIHPLLALVLAAVLVLTLAMDTLLGLLTTGMFAIAWVMSRRPSG